MALPINPPTSLLEGILCSVGKIVEFLLIELAIVVAELFGFTGAVATNLRQAELALAGHNCY